MKNDEKLDGELIHLSFFFFFFFFFFFVVELWVAWCSCLVLEIRTTICHVVADVGGAIRRTETLDCGRDRGLTSVMPRTERRALWYARRTTSRAERFSLQVLETKRCLNKNQSSTLRPSTPPPTPHPQPPPPRVLRILNSRQTEKGLWMKPKLRSPSV